VIDPATGTLYVVAKTKERPGRGAQTTLPVTSSGLHALTLRPATKICGPADISSASRFRATGTRRRHVPRRGGGKRCRSAAPGEPAPGLFAAEWKSVCRLGLARDIQPYHGWVIGYAAADLTQAPVLFNTTPDGGLGGDWMSGTGPAADADGNIYVITGNGTFDTAARAPTTVTASSN